MVKDGDFTHKIDYVTIFKKILNLKHQNCLTGSKVTAILLNGWILHIGGFSAEKGLRLQPAQQAFITIFKASTLWADSFYKSECPSACPSVRPSVRLFTFEVPFKHFFVPVSQSQMSNIFRDSESLEKSNGKKWSQIGTFFWKWS